jgi:hypothetical protein
VDAEQLKQDVRRHGRISAVTGKDRSISLSVIIATPGRWPVLADSLGSALAQSDVPLEAVVIDHGPGARLDRDAVELLSDDRVHVERGEGMNASAARNLGVRTSGGEWIAFLEDGDLWAPGHLAALTAACAEGDADFAYCASWVVDEQRRIRGFRAVPHADQLADELLAENVIGTPSSVVVRRAFWERAGGFDEWLDALAPWDAWIRWSRAGAPCMVPAPTVAARHVDHGHGDDGAARAELEELKRRYSGDAKRAGKRFGREPAQWQEAPADTRPPWLVMRPGAPGDPPRAPR